MHSLDLRGLARRSARPGDIDYARTDNPTWQAFEDALGALEGGDALVLSSGMAAITAALSLVPDGARAVAPTHAYSGTSALLDQAAERGRLTVDTVDVADTSAVVAALAGADLLWLESPTNPLLEVADLPAICAAARETGTLTVVDNTFATPLVQRPLDLGADVVVHSVTKYLSGHSDVLLGAVVARRRPGSRPRRAAARHRRLTGSIAGPAEVWLALRGLRTLACASSGPGDRRGLARRLRSPGCGPGAAPLPPG